MLGFIKNWFLISSYNYKYYWVFFVIAYFYILTMPCVFMSTPHSIPNAHYYLKLTTVYRVNFNLLVVRIT